MKFTVVALLAALTTSCFSQTIDIASPTNGTRVTPGSTLVVEVDQPVTLYNVNYISNCTDIVSIGQFDGFR